MRYIKYVLILFISIFIFDIYISAYTAYSVGQEVEYNSIKFYVINDSSSSEDTVTLLKKEPLTVDEVNLYGGVGTENNHVNQYSSISQGTATNQNGYGGMQYYSSSTCGYIGNSWLEEGCKTSYEDSEIKYVVDAWKKVQTPLALEARLITKEEYGANHIPKSNYNYWTSSAAEHIHYQVYYIFGYGGLWDQMVYGNYVVRPVIVLSKITLGDEDEIVIDDDTDKGNDKLSKVDSNDTKGLNTADNEISDIKSTVKVANTYMRDSILLIVLGLISSCVSIILLYKLMNKEK